MHEILGTYGNCCFGNCDLFAIYYDRDLKIWRMNSAFDMTFIRLFRFPSYIKDGFQEYGTVVMDDEYIVVFIWTGRRLYASEGWWTVYFVSTKTFGLRRSRSIACKYGFDPRYERGFLILQSREHVR